MIRAGVLHVPFGSGRHAPIAAEDQVPCDRGDSGKPEPASPPGYPLYGPVEFTYAEIARSSAASWGAGAYKQVSIETDADNEWPLAGRKNHPQGINARALYGEFEPKPEGQGDSFAIQHLREVAIDSSERYLRRDE